MMSGHQLQIPLSKGTCQWLSTMLWLVVNSKSMITWWMTFQILYKILKSVKSGLSLEIISSLTLEASQTISMSLVLKGALKKS